MSIKFNPIQFLLVPAVILMAINSGCTKSGHEANGVDLEYPVYVVAHINPTVKRIIEQEIVPAAESRGINDKTGVVLLTNTYEQIDVCFYDRTDSIPISSLSGKFSYIQYSDELTIYLCSYTQEYCNFDFEESKGSQLTTRFPKKFPVYLYDDSIMKNCIYGMTYKINGSSYRKHEPNYLPTEYYAEPVD